MNKVDVFLLKLEPDIPNYHIAPPFGILYLSSALEQKGFKVKLYHEIATRQKLALILEDILANKPLFVGISTMTGPSLLPSLQMSRKIKKKSEIPVVWGGLHATMLPEQTLRNENIDVVVIGEGEETITDLAEAFLGDGHKLGRFKEIKGIGYKENGQTRINSFRPFISNLDKYSLAWHHLDIERYIYRGKYFFSEMGSKLPGDRICAFMTSRGCPWRCGYCYNQFVNKRTFRAHSAERIINDIHQLKKKHNLSAIIFEDDDFFANRKRALEIIRRIDIPWGSSIRANYLAQWGEDFIKELSEHQCVELRIGAESGSPRVLEIMQKDINIEDIHRTIELCQKYNINHLTGFMVGMPGETWTDVLQTLGLMDEIEKKGNVVNGPALFLPYPGTPLYEAAVQMGFKPPQRLEAWARHWGPRQPRTPFVERKARFIGYYRTLALRKDTSSFRFQFFVKFLKNLAEKRWQKRYFSFPVDYHLPKLILSLLRPLGLKKLA